MDLTKSYPASPTLVVELYSKIMQVNQDEMARERTDLAELRTGMATERTDLAYERKWQTGRHLQRAH